MKRPLLFEDRPADAPRAPNATSVRAGLLAVLLIFVGTRLVVWTATYYGTFMLYRIEFGLEPPLEKHQAALNALPPESEEWQRFVYLFGHLKPLSRFDGQHYKSIVEGGYRYEVPPPNPTRAQLEQNIAFFPLFPMVSWLLTGGLHAQVAMVLVAHAACLAAVVCLYLWIRRRIDAPTALLAVAVTLCWPSACYYSYAYAESLTLLTFVLAAWMIDRGAFVGGAVASGLATATRPTALAIAAVFGLAYWFNRKKPVGARLLRLAPLMVIAVSGIAAYALYLTVRFGSPTVYLDNFRAGWVPDEFRSSWFEFLVGARIWDQFKYVGRVFRTFPLGLINLTNSFFWNMPLNFFILFLSLAGLGRVPRSFRPLLALGPLVFLHAYLASGGATFGVEPMGRYMAVCVPALVVLAVWCQREWRPGARTVMLVVFMLAQAAWAFRFGLGEWSS